jgi:hypothetical protein
VLLCLSHGIEEGQPNRRCDGCRLMPVMHWQCGSHGACSAHALLAGLQHSCCMLIPTPR